ncbi:MAG: hypothetical protein COT15_02615 [Candidatus Diapherotrites archaeon CG08_land_8_20_14_0_20_34_12]|nr:MAG: hypothetical protein COT15_02615 [Candidatus Diapherotrites archaeon CG08_land_8_20_14_0_20_34_12]
MFGVLTTKTFASELKKLQKHEIKRIKEKINDTKANPFRFFERLSGLELYRLRIGKFRVIVSINFSLKTITLISVGLRKKVYDNV